MAYFADDFNRTSPAGPGDSTAGTPDYELGANWTSWTSDGDRGAVIHADALSQYQEWNFHGWAAPDDAAASDDIAVRLTIDTSITSFHIALRASDAAIAEGSSGAAGGPHLDDHATGGVVFRVQMQFGTPGQVTMMVDSAYQGPTDITGSTRYDDGLSHTYEARVVGDTVTLHIDGALKFTRNDMGTLPTGSTRRRVAVGWPGDGDQQHVDNWESGDHPLSAVAAAGLTTDPSDLAAFFIRNQRQLHLWEGSPGATVAAVEGAAAASFGGTFTAAGVPNTLGVAVASFGFAATALGVDRAIGQAVATFTFTATTAGHIIERGVAVASFGGTLTASGTPRTPGAATATFGYTATALGVTGTLPVQGQAVANFDGTFTALGIDRALGVAVAAYGFTATSTGQQQRTGTATASFGYTATAAALPRVHGVATASFGFTAAIFIITYKLSLVAVGVNRYSATTSSSNRYSGAAGGNRYSVEED